MSDTPVRAAAPAYRTILVPLDGSDAALRAVPTAQALGRRFGAAVSVSRAILPQAAAVDDCMLCLSTDGHGRVAGPFAGSVARGPVVVVGPFVGRPNTGRDHPHAPLEADRLVACVDGHEASEAVLPVAAAWAHALGMKLTIVTVAEPCPPPLRIGAPWRRGHGPEEDADEYVRRLADRWSIEAPGVDGDVVYDPISPASGMRDYLAARPTGLIAIGSPRRGGLHHLLGSAGAGIVHASTVPALVVPVV